MDNFKCKELDTFESGTISFDFCGICYSACSRRCRDYGQCYACEHQDTAYCLNCSRAEENKKAE